MDPRGQYSVAGYDSLLHKVVAILAVFTFISVWLYRVVFTISYPKNLRHLGEKEGIKWEDMRRLFMDDSLSVFNDVYQNYSKKHLAVLVPVFGPNDEVFLPPSSLQWLVRQPDEVASSMHAQIDGIGLDYSLGHKFAYDSWGGMLIKTDLNASLETMCALMNNEVAAAVDGVLGRSEQWKEVKVLATCRTLIGRVTLSFTLGDSPEGRKLCRDEAFLASCYSVLDGMLDTATVLATTRRPLKPWYGARAARPMKAKLDDLAQRFAPLYRERLQILEGKSNGKKETEPKDVVQMLMAYAARHRPQELHSLADMTRRLAVIIFGSMHQTVLVLHNLLLDIVDTNTHHSTIAQLRAEVARVIMGVTDAAPGAGKAPAYDGTHVWSRTQAAELVRLDSCARETLRLRSFLGRSVQRRVLAPEGLTTEDGIRLPRGTTLSILTHQTQTDPDVFADPEAHDPFRFARPREAAADPATGRPGLGHLSFASTGAESLAFGHGRHACPGRSLVDIEFKMIVAYVLMNYDVEFPEEYEGKRPSNTWFAGFGIPPLEAKLKVRKRGVSS